jgi:hypothetical protein
MSTDYNRIAAGMEARLQPMTVTRVVEACPREQDLHLAASIIQRVAGIFV